ncbi:hypothetical protein BS50DRAFT_630835 [Corynespora cassiicola Philippines]|uniref:SMP domain-containing protein n=1 Tax=Corynespora cassiicola Philippines TaxID=1448308 RepID=A0A2T2NZA6_CORCC|nr:hypothetical protein BS50DRAFT_630835 [Corynespora cassiicola Philippines]
MSQPNNNSSSTKKGSKSNSMTKSDASRIQSTQVTGGKYVGTSSFAARAQAAADKNNNNISKSKKK